MSLVYYRHMNTTPYIEGFVLSVKKEKLTAYKKMAKMMAELCKKHGALSYVEAVADDLGPHTWPHADFRTIAKTKEDEIVVFAYIVYPDKKTRIRAQKAIDADMKVLAEKKRMDMSAMPFEMKRMAYGGFKSIVAY